METLVMTEEFGMEEALAQSDQAKPGAIVEGTVVGQSDSNLLINVGLKQEAVLSVKEFLSDVPTVGQTLTVLILKTSGPEGRPIVSWKKARLKKNWDELELVFKAGKSIEGKITKRIKGGVNVDIGLDAFMPASQIDEKPVSQPEKWVGSTVLVHILEMDFSKGNVLVSRRRVLDAEKAVRREATLGKLVVGQKITGKVKGLTKFGAFIDIGGIEGLLHISDMSWVRVEKPQDVLKAGQEIEVQVLNFDAANNKISLGRKQLLPHPWEGIEKKYPLGSVIKGRVTGLAPFGAFVEIEPGIEGLIHISEISWIDHVKKVQDVLKTGQEISAQVLSLDRKNEKLSLSLKRMLPNPWKETAKVYPAGSTCEGEVINITKFGAFIKLSTGIEGLLKAQDISWTERTENLEKHVKKGEKIKVAVLDISVKEERISLGIKQLTRDPLKTLKIGQAVQGKVVKKTDFGVFVKLDMGIDGLIRNSELALKKSIFSDTDPSMRKPKQVEIDLNVGDEISTVITKINHRDRKLDLSLKRYEQQQEKTLLKKYSGGSGNPTLGEATGWDALEQSSKDTDNQ